jgi:chorismate mutase / prephenate dehydratase
MAPRDLQSLREALEGVDRELLAILKRRMGLVEEVAEAKLAGAFPFRDLLREEHVLQRVRHLAVEHQLDAHEVERLYRVVMEMSVARQQAHVRGLPTTPLRVAYQGVEGSYSHLTAQRRYGGRAGGALLSGCESFRAVVEQVTSGAADLALLPIENTTAGSINETYDLLAEGGITITGEVVSHIEHCLLGLPGATVEQLRRVLSHPQALLQCQSFLAAAPWLTAEAEFDTAGAARKVREGGDPVVAAIASEAAGRTFGLAVLQRGIQTQQGNFTRFVEVATTPAPCPPDASCKTSLLLALEDRPGALGEVLGELGRRGVNLTKLESRPVPGSPWRYRFYLDLEGHAAGDRVSGALAAIAAMASDFRVLGTYPRTPVDPS